MSIFNTSSSQSFAASSSMFSSSLETKLNLLLNSVNGLSERVQKMEIANKQPSKSNNIVQQLSFNDIGIEQEAGIKLERLINKKLRYENHLNVFKTHLNRSTAPPSYFYCYFPKPFLWNDEDFVEMHNNRIKNTQKLWMEEDIKHIQKAIDGIVAAIDGLKTECETNELINGNIDEIVDKIQSQVDLHLMPFSSSSSEKLNRKTEMLYYKVKTDGLHRLNHSASDSNDNHSSNSNNNHNNSNNRAVQRHRSSRSKSNPRFNNHDRPQHSQSQRFNNNKASNQRKPTSFKHYNATSSAFNVVPNRVTSNGESPAAN